MTEKVLEQVAQTNVSRFLDAGVVLELRHRALFVLHIDKVVMELLCFRSFDFLQQRRLETDDVVP